MNRYILIPEDTIRVLPPEDGVEAAVEVFCSRTVIFFDISQIQDVRLFSFLSVMMAVVVAGLRDIICLFGKIQRFRRICPESGQKRREIGPIRGDEHHLFPLKQAVRRREAERIGAPAVR